MYDELVKRLRNCATQAAPCKTCGLIEDGSCSDTLMKQAADAIEDLEFACNRYEKDYKALCEYLPKWIPVTERLPEPKFAREWYLVALESGCVKTLAFEKQGRSDNLFRPGWHETASPVTHWMPLPEPPKEEK